MEASQTRRSMRGGTAQPEYGPIETEGRSQRFIRFHKAFNHAFKQANERWTDDDLRSCFPTMYAKNPALFQQIRQIAIEDGRAYALGQEHELNKANKTADALDALHEAILDAKDRVREATEHPNEAPTYADTWSPTLDPQAAVRAHFVPLMRAEIERVKKQILEIEARDELLDYEMRANIAAHAAATNKVKALLTNVRSVADQLGTRLETDKMVEWALEVDETGEA